MSNFLQELLLFTGSTFAGREWVGKTDSPDNSTGKSMTEAWQEACWNGMLPELLPELFDQVTHTGKQYIWNVYEGHSFIGIEMGEQDITPENLFSINPERFISFYPLN